MRANSGFGILSASAVSLIALAAVSGPVSAGGGGDRGGQAERQGGDGPGRGGEQGQGAEQKGGGARGGGAEQRERATQPGQKSQQGQQGERSKGARDEKAGDGEQRGRGQAEKRETPERAQQKGAEEKGGERKGGEQKGAEQKGTEQKGTEQKGAEQKGERGDKDRSAAEQRGEERDQGQRKAGDDAKPDERKQTGEDRRREDGAEGRESQAGRDRDTDKAAVDRKVKEVREKVTSQERDRVRDVLRRRESELRRANDVRVRVDLGVILPRDVAVYDLPPDFIDVVPAYRGYRYVLVEDELVIVDPETYVVVDVVPRGGSATGVGRGEAGSARLELTKDEERFIRDHVSFEREVDLDLDLAVGADIPGSIDLVTFPDPVISEVPKVRDYRYIVVDDEIVIVDPGEKNVVYLITD